MSRLIFIIICIVFSAKVIAAKDVYYFDTVKQSNDFIDIIEGVRCLVCQNQSLSDSSAPMAQELKKYIQNKVLKNFSKKHIKSSLKNKYGEYILFKPSFKHSTALLWLIPYILLFLIILRLKKI